MSSISSCNHKAFSFKAISQPKNLHKLQPSFSSSEKRWQLGRKQQMAAGINVKILKTNACSQSNWKEQQVWGWTRINAKWLVSVQESNLTSTFCVNRDSLDPVFWLYATRSSFKRDEQGKPPRLWVSSFLTRHPRYNPISRLTASLTLTVHDGSRLFLLCGNGRHACVCMWAMMKWWSGAPPPACTPSKPLILDAFCPSWCLHSLPKKAG